MSPTRLPRRQKMPGNEEAVSPPALRRWQQELIAQIERHKRLPSGAQGHAGVVRVAFSIDETGKLISAHIAASSGSAILDDAAIDLIRRARPSSPPPQGLNVSELSFVAPIRYLAGTRSAHHANAILDRLRRQRDGEVHVVDKFKADCAASCATDSTSNPNKLLVVELSGRPTERRGSSLRSSAPSTRRIARVPASSIWRGAPSTRFETLVSKSSFSMRSTTFSQGLGGNSASS